MLVTKDNRSPEPVIIFIDVEVFQSGQSWLTNWPTLPTPRCYGSNGWEDYVAHPVRYWKPNPFEYTISKVWMFGIFYVVKVIFRMERANINEHQRANAKHFQSTAVSKKYSHFPHEGWMITQIKVTLSDTFNENYNNIITPKKDLLCAFLSLVRMILSNMSFFTLQKAFIMCLISVLNR